MKSLQLVGLFCLTTLIMAACSSAKPVPLAEANHRYFLEVNRPGTVYALLENSKYKGAMIPLVEINDNGQAGDTLNAWVQHYNGRTKFAPEATGADIIIACYRESQPTYAQAMHVLPESEGKIYVYMMEGGVLIVSDERISFYDVLIAVRNARQSSQFFTP